MENTNTHRNRLRKKRKKADPMKNNRPERNI